MRGRGQAIPSILPFLCPSPGVTSCSQWLIHRPLLGAGGSDMYSPGVSEMQLGGRDYIYPHKLLSKESRERKTGGRGGGGS